MAGKTRYAQLTYEFKQDGDQWLARCIELGTSVFADTLDEAQEAIREMAGLNLQTLAEVGELDAFAKKRGLRLLTHSPGGKPRQVQVKPDRFVSCATEPVAALM